MNLKTASPGRLCTSCRRLRTRTFGGKVGTLLLLLGFVSTLSRAATDRNWPQFRGPHASGTVEGPPVPTTWDVEKKEHLRWSTPIPGLGHSSPIIWGDRVYISTAVQPSKAELKVGLYGDIEPVEEHEETQWRLLALDAVNGKVEWNSLGVTAVPRLKRHPKSTHCNSTPCTDGTHLVAIFGSEGLFCFNLKGELLWKKDLGPMASGYYVVPSAEWGFGSSPILHDGKVIVLCDVLTNSFLAAYSVVNGKELWRVPRNDVPTWGTPAVVESRQRTQVVVNGWHHIAGYELGTGKELWSLDGGGDIPVPTPIYGNGLIYLTSAHGNSRPMRAIRPDAVGSITPAELGMTNRAIAWVHPRQGCYMQTPILVGDFLYGCLDNGVLTCFDARTGVIQYSERLGDGGQGFTASPVASEGNLYFTSELGNVFVVGAGPRFSVTATNGLGETCMATPAISQGVIYFRTRSHLVAISNQVSGKQNDPIEPERR